MSRLFTDILRDHRNGKLVERLTQEFASLMEAVEDTEQAGSISLSLKVIPSKGDDGTFEIVPTIKLSLPVAPLPKALFYSDGTGGLVREPPIGGKLFAASEVESDREDERQRRRSRD
jgi:hypothetical protein